MSTELASLGIEIDSTPVGRARAHLDELTAAGGRSEEQIKAIAMAQTALNFQMAAAKDKAETIAKINERKAATEALVKRIQDQIAAEKQAEANADSMISKLGDVIGKYATWGLVVGSVTRALHDMWTEGHEAIETQVRLNAMLRAAGSTSGRTENQLDILAQRLSERSSRFDDTDMKQGMATMLKFSSVHSDVFDKAMEVSAKFSEFTGRDMNTSAQAIGRALEAIASGRGSGTGLRGLEEQFGKLTMTQRNYLDELVKLGDVTGAHNFLLDTFSKKMGDIYQDMTDSGVNSVARFKKAWNELMEELGRPPKTGGVLDWLINKGTESFNAWTRFLRPGGFDEVADNVKRRMLIEGANSRDPAAARRAREELGKLDAEKFAKQKEVDADEEMRRDAARSEAIIAADKRAAELRAEEWKKGAAKRKADADKAAAEYAQSLTAQNKIEDEARALGMKFLKDQDDKRLAEEQHVQQLSTAGWVAYAQKVVDEDYRMTEQLARDQMGANKKMGEFAKEAARGIQRGFSDGLFDIMQGKFDDMGNRFKAMLDRMVADALAAKIASKMFGDMDKTGDIGGWVGKGLGWLSGLGTQAPAPVVDMSFATGTNYVPRTGLALVHQGEKIIPADENKRGSGMTNIFNFTITGQTDRRSQAQIAAAAGEGVQRAMARNS